MTIAEFTSVLNQWGKERTPFLFVVDFELKKPLAFRLDEVNPDHIRFSCNGFTNQLERESKTGSIPFKKYPIPQEKYEHQFRQVLNHLNYGDSFLTNLTIKTLIETDRSLNELYSMSRSKYKLLVNDQFLVFSPETFIQIRDSKIFSFPMKGTIDARTPHAAAVILQDVKEMAEHVTIVDLIRNDLSQVATQVHVARFRYLDEIKTQTKNLLQVSSEVVGDLAPDYPSRLGDILVALLPAGSVSGAPKCKTLEIIREAEQEDRGYYTGVFGYYDGKNLDSGVMIRYIEKEGSQYFYRSGGGITTQSVAAQEYNEALDKIYVPVD
jgi:para-aminobenzoate synthetase component I